MPNTSVPESNQNPVSKGAAPEDVEGYQEQPTGFDFRSKPADFEFWGPPSGLKSKR